MNDDLHQPVLLQAVLDTLQPQAGEKYLDLTVGYGGHARRILERTQNYTQATLVDRDNSTMSYLKDLTGQGVQFMNCDFLAACRELVNQNKKFDLILLDIGVSSPQLDQADRGFSFQHEAKLDMRMDQTSKLTADYVVNRYSKARLIDILVKFGEEKPKTAERLAIKIVTNRPITTTTQLAELVLSTKGRKGRTHPATTTFQAIRIEVNQELEQLTQTLDLLSKLLNSKGRVAIISFHSLEDRIVKNFFSNDKNKGLLSQFQILTKRPLMGKDDLTNNPRARSAILRVAMKK